MMTRGALGVQDYSTHLTSGWINLIG